MGEHFGTTLGPHVMHDGERPALLCTSCRAKSRRLTPVTRENAFTAIFWGQVVAGSNPVSPTSVMSRDIVDRCPETSLAFRACFGGCFRI
jgi:hypothetical protein